MEPVVHFLNSPFIPTVVVASLATVLTYRQTRAGQRDTKEMQVKANAVSETQSALEAWKELYQAEKARRVEAEEESATLRKLRRDEFEKAIRSCDVDTSSEYEKKTNNKQPKGNK